MEAKTETEQEAKANRTRSIVIQPIEVKYFIRKKLLNANSRRDDVVEGILSLTHETPRRQDCDRSSTAKAHRREPDIPLETATRSEAQTTHRSDMESTCLGPNAESGPAVGPGWLLANN